MEMTYEKKIKLSGRELLLRTTVFVTDVSINENPIYLDKHRQINF